MENSLDYFVNEAKKNNKVEMFLNNGIKIIGKIVKHDDHGIVFEDFNKKTNENVLCFVNHKSYVSMKVKLRGKNE